MKLLKVSRLILYIIVILIPREREKMHRNILGPAELGFKRKTF